MLTCDICGEEMMLEEDMKTHLLLAHLENDMHCPLCSLCGVSYDELCFHLSSAHPEKQQPGAQDSLQLPSSADHCVGTHTAAAEGDHPTIAMTTEVTPSTAPCVTTHCKPPEQNSSPESCSSSSGDMKTSKHRKATRKRPSQGTKEFPCPICSLVCSSCFTLQEHVELHLQDQSLAEGSTQEALTSPSTSTLPGEKRFECPLCSILCSNSFSLQEHVELHLDNRAESPDSDLKLAMQLQQEEEKRRRQEEAWQEKEEFKKLQRQFGVDGRGGYSKQLQRTMETAVSRGAMGPAEFHRKRAEMMESLASGLDDGRTRTQGVVRALHEYYQTECRDCVHVWLSADTDHYCSSVGDKGWGCGYRNIQMLLSSLQRTEPFASTLQDKAMPSIPRVQSMIEEAWKEGLDPQGASHFKQQLQGTRAWIGATEIFSLFTSLGIHTHIMDFHRPTGPGDTHPRLFDWVKQYFCRSSRGSSRLPPRLIQTSLPPLYLQHQGHSRSIVGLEQKKNGALCLLLLDPGLSVPNARKLLSKDTLSTAIRHIRKFPSSLKHRQYQVVALQGVLSAEEKQIAIVNSRTLRSERIP